MNPRILIALVVPLLFGASSVQPIEQGRVAGRVVDATGAPMADVQVFLVSDAIGTLSRSTGTFVMPSVPVGTYEIRAVRIGFGTVTRQIVVEEGAHLEVNFQLTESAVGLDEIVSDRREQPAFRTRVPSEPLRPEGTPRLAASGVSFTPMIVKPELENFSEVRQAMASAYPVELRPAGSGGTVVARLYLDATGEVQRVLISSVQPAGLPNEASLIQAAQAAAGVARFSAAFNYSQRVPVWVQVPLTFRP